jgi:hypothetical protein
MEVSEGVERWLAYEEHVYQLAMVGHQRAEAAPPGFLREPPGIVDRQAEHALRALGAHRRGDVERTKHVCAVAGVDAVPPSPATREHEGQNQRRSGDDTPAACPASRVGNFAGREHGLARRSAKDGQRPDK